MFHIAAMEHVLNRYFKFVLFGGIVWLGLILRIGMMKAGSKKSVSILKKSCSFFSFLTNAFLSEIN